MTYGLKIYNAAGYLQIDENFAPYTVQSVGAVNGTTTYDYGDGDVDVFPYINGDYVYSGNLGVQITTTKRRVPQISVDVSGNKTEILDSGHTGSIFARLKNGPTSTSYTYGLLVRNQNNQAILNSNDTYFCITQEVSINIGISSQQVVVPINAGDYSSSTVWLMCGVTSSQGIHRQSASSNNLFQVNPYFYRSGSNLVLGADVSSMGSSSYASLYPTSNIYTFAIGVIP